MNVQAIIDELRSRGSNMLSLDTPQEQDGWDIAADIGIGFTPGLGTAQAMRDFERARREDDGWGMALSGLGMLPFVGGVVKGAKGINKAVMGGEKVVDVVDDLDDAAKISKAQEEHQKFLQSLGKTEATQNRVIQRTADKLAPTLDNGKLTPDVLASKARSHALRKLRWDSYDKPNLQNQYGELVRSKYTDSAPRRLKNTEKEVDARATRAEEFLAQPTEPWVPREFAFERAPIQDALEGFPGVEQTRFQRYEPTGRTDLSHVDETYLNPRNRSLIIAQTLRGLRLGGETFYGSLYPVYQEAMTRGIAPDQFNKWVEAVAPASARNSIMNEHAVGNMLMNMNYRGIPLTKENVDLEMARFKDQYGIGLPLMPVHRQGVANVLEGGQSLRDKLNPVSRAADAPEYKIPTYGVQKTGDFAHSWVGDVHEAAGETLASPYHPYFKESGGFKKNEYGRAESHMLDIASELGIPGGMAQAGRWFGGGELTGLKSPRGDALDILEKQVAYTLHGMGKEVTPQSVRDYTMKLIQEGGDLMPWFRGDAMPDKRF